MSVLAFDTCFGRISVAVRHPGVGGAWAIAGAGEILATGHAERLLPMVQSVMRDARVTFRDLTRIAVSIGPGTFTGVRTGIATARAIALATGKPVCGIGTLALMRATAVNNSADLIGFPLVVAVDARRGEVYIEHFAGDGSPLIEPQILPVEAALALLPASGLTLVGSGGPVLRAAAAMVGRHLETRLPDLEPDARALAALADTLPIIDIVKPLYLRAPDAKPQAAKSLPRA